ncbi:MAG: DUF6541 family protein [Bacteroidota bacterium]
MWHLLLIMLLQMAIMLLFFIVGAVPSLRFLGLRGNEAVAGSFGISALVFGFSAFAAFLLGIPNLWPLLCVVTAGAVLAATGWHRGLRDRCKELTEPRCRFPIFIWFLASIEMLFFQILTPCYSGASYWGDWWMHYDLTQVFLNLRDVQTRYFGVVSVASRTPLFNWLGSFFQGVFTNQFYVYQMVECVVGAGIFPAVYLLAERLIGGRAAKAAVFVLMASPFLIYNIIHPWPKALVSYLLLMMIYFMVKIVAGATDTKSFILLGLFAGGAYLAHPSALFEIFWTGAFTLFLVVTKRVQPRRALGALAAVAVLVLPWIVWEFATFGIQGTISASPALTYRGLGGGASLHDKIIIAATQFYPYNLVHGGGLFGNILEFGRLNGILRYYRAVLPGAVTTTLSLFLIFYVVNHDYRLLRGKPARHKPSPPLDVNDADAGVPGGASQAKRLSLTYIVGLTSVGFLGLIATVPHLHTGGLAAETLTTTVILTAVLATCLLFDFSRVVRLTVAAVLTLESAFAIGLQFYSNKMIDHNLDLKLEHQLTFLWDYVYKTDAVARILVIAVMAGVFLYVYRSVLRSVWVEEVKDAPLLEEG